MRWERSVGCSGTASCRIATLSYVVPSAASVTRGRRVLHCAVSSHSLAQSVRSRPEAVSSSTSRSLSCVLPHACLSK